MAKKRIAERDHDIPEEDKSIIEKLVAIDERVAIMMGNEMLLAGIDTVSAMCKTCILFSFTGSVNEATKKILMSFSVINTVLVKITKI